MRRCALALLAALLSGLGGIPSSCGGDPCVDVCEQSRSCSATSGITEDADCVQECERSREEASGANCLEKHDDYVDCVERTGDACAFLEAAASEQGPAECVSEFLGHELCLLAIELDPGATTQ